MEKIEKKKLAFVLATSGEKGYMAGNVCLGINEHYTAGEFEIIVHHNNTSEEDINALQKIDRVKTINFSFDDIFVTCLLENAYRGSKVRDENSMMAFAHYEIFKYLEEYETVVWLDTDVLIQKNINDLISESSFSITLDLGWDVKSNFNLDIPNYDMDRDGLCSAVIVVKDTLPYAEIHEWCYKKTVELAKNLFNRDQGIINLVVQEFNIPVNTLSNVKWQCMPWNEEAVKANIVHFGGNNKIESNTKFLERFPKWANYHHKWLGLGGSNFIKKDSIDDISNKLFEVSFRRQNLRYESKRVDDVLRISKEFAAQEANSFARKKTLNGSYKDEIISDWIVPKNRTLTGLSCLLGDVNPKNIEVIHAINSQQNKTQIAIVFGGGLGDALKPMTIIPELVRKLNCEITIVSDQKATFDIKDTNPYVKNIIYSDRNPYEYAEKHLINSNLLDATIVCKYTLNYYLRKSVDAEKTDVRSIALLSEESKKCYNKYNFSNLGWPGMNNAFSRELKKNNANVSKIIAESSGLKISEDEIYNIPFFIRIGAISGLLELIDAPFITVHYGFDTKKLPNKKQETNYNCTKNISLNKWEKTISEISTLGIMIIQLGAPHEEKINNVDYYLNGQTSLEQTALILKNSLCHIDTEGGLVHLARAVHTRSVVMFGPTPVGMFGYPQNINLEPKGCRECFWTTSSWVLECPRNTQGPDCMEEHDPGTVLDAVRNVLLQQRIITLDLIQAEKELKDIYLLINKHFDQAKLYSRGRVLVVCMNGDLPELKKMLAGVYCEILFNIVVDEIGSDQNSALGDNVEYGSFINLRHSSGTFDFVVCMTASWKHEIGHHILQEMTRVLNEGGILIAMYPPNSKEDKSFKSIYKSSKLKIVLSASEVNNPSLIVLRKKPYDSGDLTLIPIRQNVNQDITYPDKKPIVAVSPLSKELELMHQSANSRLDEAYSHHHEYIKSENKNWDLSDHFIRGEFVTKEWISVDRNSLEQYGPKFLLHNWFGPEEWGCWGRGIEHTLLLPLDSTGFEECGIEIQAILQIRFTKGNDNRVIRVTVDNNIIGDCEVNHRRRGDHFEMRAWIPKDLIMNKRYIVVQLETDTIYVPSQEEDSCSDHRALGIGLIKFRYRLSDNTSKIKQELTLKNV